MLSALVVVTIFLASAIVNCKPAALNFLLPCLKPYTRPANLPREDQRPARSRPDPQNRRNRLQPEPRRRPQNCQRCGGNVVQKGGGRCRRHTCTPHLPPPGAHSERQS